MGAIWRAVCRRHGRTRRSRLALAPAHCSSAPALRTHLEQVKHNSRQLCSLFIILFSYVEAVQKAYKDGYPLFVFIAETGDLKPDQVRSKWFLNSIKRMYSMYYSQI